jgi:hypothetical protein
VLKNLIGTSDVIAKGPLISPVAVPAIGLRLGDKGRCEKTEVLEDDE